MVKRYLAFFIIALLIPALSLAGEFNATVSSNNASIGESFELKLELKDSSAKSDPDISVLQQDFTIASQGKSSSTTIINGSVSSGINWHYTLLPKKEGNVTIPPVSIKTSDGTLSSQPIAMEIGKASNLPSADKDKNISISSEISTKSPYKNQPVIYNVKLVSKKSLNNVSLGDLNIDNAIVQIHGKPEISNKVVNGIAVNVIEINYIITPLKSGEFTIPPVVIKGEMPVKIKSQFADPFGIMNNDPDMFGIQSLQPFAIASEAKSISVKQEVSQVSPWLPATSLKISENETNTQKFKVGEPLTRTITIVAENLSSSQLPDLTPEQVAGSDFKVYSDKPTVDDDIKNNKILSWKTKNYTLIPTKPGKIQLPEITISWWDTENNKAASATLAARTIDVMEGDKQLSNPPATTTENKQEPQTAPVEKTTPSPTPTPVNNLFYYVIAGLVVLLLAVFLWVVRLQRKVINLSSGSSNISTKQDLQEQKPVINNIDLTSVNNAKELQEFLQNYASAKFGIGKNSPLENIFSLALKQSPELNKEDIRQVIKSIEDALYNDKEIDLATTKEQCASIIKSIENKTVSTKKKIETLPDLNPS